MLQSICHKIFFDLLGWKEEITEPDFDKCIICVAPHTSNWDFILAQLYYHSKGRTAGFLMKREWFFWPLGPLFRKMGGVPVERSRHTSLTDQLATRARQARHFELAVTPEGTRSLVTTWKRGFYFIALKAQIPIKLYAIDYENRTVRCTLSIMPSGDINSDMKQIMEYYRHIKGIHPEKFAVEEIS